MNTDQTNKLTMLQTVALYLIGAGQPLTQVKRIADGLVALQEATAAIVAAAGQQDLPTTGVTRSRDEVKAEASNKAEVLRLLVLALSPDPTLRAQLKPTVARMAQGKDDDYLHYLAMVVAGIGTLPDDELKDAGYDPEVLATLQTDLTTLTDTQGAARQIQIGTSTATGQLPALLATVDAVLADTLDPLVRAQVLRLPTEVAGYDRARRIVHAAARRRPRYSGTVAAGMVALVYDRREAGVPDPTLTNRSGKGLALRYYTAESATERPTAGAGILVKNRTEVHLPDYAKLGPDPDAPYLLVVLEGVDGEGHWGVK